MRRTPLSSKQSWLRARSLAVPEPPAHWPGIPSLAPYEDPYDDDSDFSELLMDEDLLAPEDDDSLHQFETLDETVRQRKVPMNRKKGAKNTISHDLDRYLAQTDVMLGGARGSRARGSKARGSKATESAAAPAQRSGMLPVMDAGHNLREIAKQLVLLEDHLFQPNKRCQDCIRKHLLTAEALAEEAVTLDGAEEHADITADLADKLRDVQRLVLQGDVSKEKIAQQIRTLRKALSKASFGVVEQQKVAMPPSAAPTFKAAVGAFRRLLVREGHAILNTRATVYDGVGFQVAAPPDLSALTERIESELGKAYGIMVGAEKVAGGKAFIWIAPDTEAEHAGSASVLDARVGPEPVRGGEPALGMPVDAAAAARGSRAKAPKAQVAGATLAEAVAAFRTEWVGRKGILDAAAASDAGKLMINATAVPGGGRGLPPAWYGWPLRVTNVTSTPGVRIVLPLARHRLVGRHGVTAVGIEKNPTLRPPYRLVAYVSGPEDLPEQALLPKTYLGYPVEVREAGTVMGSLTRLGADPSRIVGSGRAAQGIQGGDAVIYGYPRKDNPEVFDWFRGTAMNVGDTFDKWTVNSIPEGGWIAVYDAKDDTSAWIPAERVVKVPKSPISKTLAGVSVPRYDEVKLDGSVTQDVPLTESQLILADLVQGVMAPHLGKACTWAGLDPDLVASSGCQKDVPTKITLAAITNAIYESGLDPQAKTAEAGGGDAVGLFGLRSRSSAGSGLTVAERKNPITSTERVLEILRDTAAPMTFKNLLLRDAKASIVAPTVGAEGGVTVGEYAQAWTAGVQMPPNRQAKALVRAKTADAMAAGKPTERLAVPAAAPIAAPGAATPYRSLGEYALAQAELQAFRARWAANVPVGTAVHDAMRAEEKFMSENDLGRSDSPLAKAALREAAATWQKIAFQTGELWPLARSAEASYDAKDVAATYEALGLIVKRHPASPWADVARREMASLERQHPRSALTRVSSTPTAALVLGGLAAGALVLGLAALAGQDTSRRSDWWSSSTPPGFAQ